MVNRKEYIANNSIDKRQRNDIGDRIDLDIKSLNLNNPFTKRLFVFKT